MMVAPLCEYTKSHQTVWFKRVNLLYELHFNNDKNKEAPRPVLNATSVFCGVQVKISAQVTAAILLLASSASAPHVTPLPLLFPVEYIETCSPCSFDLRCFKYFNQKRTMIDLCCLPGYCWQF